jgi:hypothetical protein
MKKIIEKYLIFIVIFVLSLLAGCKKEKIPVIKTNETTTNVTEYTATSGGNITDDGGAAVTARGVCWSMSVAPTTADSKTTDGSGSGSFSSNISGLSSATNYYIRAYATNSVGTGYGIVVSFATPSQSPGPPIAITLAAINIGKSGTFYGATLTGSVYANYSKTTVVFEYGTTEAYGQINPGATEISGGNYINVQNWVDGLNSNTLYHYRLKAVNSYGTAYGSDMTFTSSSK